mmetsp:Transcript_22938/g.35083  ORF Transcript_22938/g.35083 Transcript_22938/m.35083 type:complete len:214 (+) Transcript_22938:186-827(+)
MSKAIRYCDGDDCCRKTLYNCPGQQFVGRNDRLQGRGRCGESFLPGVTGAGNRTQQFGWTDGSRSFQATCIYHTSELYERRAEISTLPQCLSFVNGFKNNTFLGPYCSRGLVRESPSTSTTTAATSPGASTSSSTSTNSTTHSCIWGPKSCAGWYHAYCCRFINFAINSHSIVNKWSRVDATSADTVGPKYNRTKCSTAFVILKKSLDKWARL